MMKIAGPSNTSHHPPNSDLVAFLSKKNRPLLFIAALVDSLMAIPRSPPDPLRESSIKRENISEIDLSLAELNRPERRVYEVDDLIDLYFYMNIEGSLGVIRRDLVHDVFEGREDTEFNFNYHPSPPAQALDKSFAPRRMCHSSVTQELMKKGILRLPETYNLIGLSSRNEILGLRRKRTLQKHTENTLRNWERCTQNPHDEAVPQLFERMLEGARSVMEEEEADEPEDEPENEDGSNTDTNDREQPQVDGKKVQGKSQPGPNEPK